uniref:Microtubule-associated protein TORTIFOLIA1-like n=1 Tax=Rhizophora mucronata TaxID=61149 RepID=A0A2P2JS90_RHIMU
MGTEDASDGRHPSGCKNSCAVVLPRKKSTLASKSILPDCSSATAARKRGVLKSVEKKANPATFGKIDSKKTLDWKVEPSCNSVLRSDDRGLRERSENAPERRLMKPDVKRSLFSKSSDSKMLKLGGPKSGSRVVPSHEENVEFSVILKDGIENHDSNHKESEDLSLIRSQLVQIERQQSNLLDLLQNFIGSSQNGMRSLETRVHGLELALDEISYDLAVSSGRMTNTGSHRLSCCLLPGANFFSSKFRRKTDGHFSALRFSSSSGTSSLAALRQRADKNGSTNAETFNFENSRLRLQGRRGFVVNPLAEICGNSRGILEVAQH